MLKVRGEALRSVLRIAESLTATKVCGPSGPGRLFHGLLQALRGDLDALPPTSAPAVGDSLVNLVAAGMQAVQGAGPVDASALKAYHLDRIRRCIDEHLHEPALTVESVAQRLGMSVGHLHRLFAGEPLTPAQYLWQRRLERCSRDLGDQRWAARPVSDIGFR